MIDGFLYVLTVITAVGCGLNGGVFFAFSTFVMKGLARIPSAPGIAGMQGINIAAVTPPFMLALFGTAAACVALAVASVVEWGEPYAVYLLVGSLIYLLGDIVLTITYNVPRNDALARLDPNAADAATQWTRYVSSWTAANHLRTVAGLAASVLLILALRVG